MTQGYPPPSPNGPQQGPPPGQPMGGQGYPQQPAGAPQGQPPQPGGYGQNPGGYGPQPGGFDGGQPGFGGYDQEPPKSKLPLYIVIGVLVLALLGVGGWFLLGQGDDEPTATTSSSAEPTPSEDTSSSEPVETPSSEDPTSPEPTPEDTATSDTPTSSSDDFPATGECLTFHGTQDDVQYEVVDCAATDVFHYVVGSVHDGEANCEPSEYFSRTRDGATVHTACIIPDFKVGECYGEHSDQIVGYEILPCGDPGSIEVVEVKDEAAYECTEGTHYIQYEDPARTYCYNLTE